MADDPQQTIDFSLRGRQLRELRDVRVGDPDARLLLFMLDSHIGKAASWDIERDKLMAECELKRTRFYEALRLLKRLALVSVSALPGSPKQRWRIIRSNVSELAESIRDADAVRIPDSAIRIADESVRIPDESVRIPDDTTERQLTTPNASPQRTPGGGWGAVVAAMVEAGIDHPTRPVESAASRGVEPGHVLALVDHFRRHAGGAGWGPQALRYRILTAQPALPVERGWPAAPAKPAAPAVQRRGELDRLERDHGETLDALPPPELESLARRVFAGQPALWQVFRLGDGRPTDVCRLPLLRALASAQEVR